MNKSLTINELREIRLNKIQEIESQIEKSSLELEELQKKLNIILHNYCLKNGHNDVLISSKMTGRTGDHSFRGSEYYFGMEYRCTICGRIVRKMGLGYTPISPKQYKPYKQKIPNEVFDDESIAVDGKTFRAVKEEMQTLDEYINYLNSLKSRICELFGHVVKSIIFNGDYQCLCCGKLLSSKRYIDSNHNAKYRGVVNESYFCSPSSSYDISSDNFMFLPIPSFENYKMSLEKSGRQLTDESNSSDNQRLVKVRPSNKQSKF